MQLDSLRTPLLAQILPAPSHKVQASQIRMFKERHHTGLRDFRRRVERELIDAAAIPDAGLRQRRLEMFLEEVEDRVQEIQDEMRGMGWETARTGLSVLAAIPGMSPLLGLAGALWRAISSGTQTQVTRDFAYAAYARQLMQRV